MTDSTATAPTPPDAPGPEGGRPGRWAGGGWPGGPRSRGGRRAVYNRRHRAADERWSIPGRLVAAAMSRPEAVLALSGRRAPVERDGRVLNRGVQALLELVAVLDRTTNRGGGTPDPVGTRDVFAATTRMVMPARTDVHVTGRTIPGAEGGPDLRVRIYRRFGVGIGRPWRRPSAIAYFHGGGWVVGNLDSHDASCRLVAAVSGCVVVAVDYRLAPEHPFPAAVEDAVAAYGWIQRNHVTLGTAPGRVGVMGDSAGGNLAAVVAQETRPGQRSAAADVPPPVAQCLVYPSVDARFVTESYRVMGDGFLLTSESMAAYRAHYVPDPADWETVRASPILCEDLTGVAPAVVVTAGFDPLRDEGAGYALALADAGVEVEYRCYDDMVHGFFGMGVVPDCLALATEVCDAMGSLMRRAAVPADG
ncbi:MAG: alpha/beta hydrolase [Acidimicrobiales bacterium]